MITRILAASCSPAMAGEGARAGDEDGALLVPRVRVTCSEFIACDLSLFGASSSWLSSSSLLLLLPPLPPSAKGKPQKNVEARHDGTAKGCHSSQGSPGGSGACLWSRTEEERCANRGREVKCGRSRFDFGSLNFLYGHARTYKGRYSRWQEDQGRRTLLEPPGSVCVQF